MLITETHFYGLCGDQVSAISSSPPDRAYGFVDFLGRSVMTKITRTLGRLFRTPLAVLCAVGQRLRMRRRWAKATSVKHPQRHVRSPRPPHHTDVSFRGY
jgi:hypothetical protein